MFHKRCSVIGGEVMSKEMIKTKDKVAPSSNAFYSYISRHVSNSAMSYGKHKPYQCDLRNNSQKKPVSI